MLQETHILKQLLCGAVLPSHTAIWFLLLTFCFLNLNILCICGTVCGYVCMCKRVYIDGSSAPHLLF